MPNNHSKYNRFGRCFPDIAACLFILSLTLVSCKKESYSIYGDVTGMPDTQVYLSVYEEGMRVLDSTAAAGGKFSMPLPDLPPDLLFLQFEGYPDYYMPFISGEGNVSVTGNFNSNEGLKISGTPANDALQQYRDRARRPDITMRAIEAVIAGYADSVQLADSAKYYGLLEKRDSVRSVIRSMQSEYIRENPAGLLSALFASEALADSADRAGADSLIEMLDTASMPDNSFLRRLRRGH